MEDLEKIPALRHNKTEGFRDNLELLGDSAANEALIYNNMSSEKMSDIDLNKFKMLATASAIGAATALDILRPEIKELLASEGEKSASWWNLGR